MKRKLRATITVEYDYDLDEAGVDGVEDAIALEQMTIESDPYGYLQMVQMEGGVQYIHVVVSAL